MSRLYTAAKAAKVGASIKCPGCGKSLVKKTYQHKFCGPSCKDSYWNWVPGRIERTYEFRPDLDDRMAEQEMGWDAHKDNL